jgi:hypothetical protein
MRHRTVFRPHFAMPLLLAMILSADPAWVRVSVANEPKSAVAPAPGAGADRPPSEIAPRRRPNHGEGLTALALWCAVLVAGLALLSVVVVWGRSVRNLARRKPLPSTAPDPLWYLKTKPPAPPAPAGLAPTDETRRPGGGELGSDSSHGTRL